MGIIKELLQIYERKSTTQVRGNSGGQKKTSVAILRFSFGDIDPAGKLDDAEHFLSSRTAGAVNQHRIGGNQQLNVHDAQVADIDSNNDLAARFLNTDVRLVEDLSLSG